MTAGIPFPAIDPVAIEIGPLVIRWYALAYIAGLVLGWRYCRYLGRRAPSPIAPEVFDDLLLWATLGVVIGGRLGYVIFYNPGYFLAHPLQILMLWQGGMSFHGGLLGVTVSIILFCRRRGVPMLTVGDIVAAAAPIGLFFGRIANFINAELFGRVTDVPWGVIFPGGGPQPRHPSQLYEALLEGAVLFGLLYLLAERGGLRHRGMMIGCFLGGYGLSRFIVEFFREPDAHLGPVLGILTMGQILSLPMIMAGIAVAAWARRRPSNAEAVKAGPEKENQEKVV